LRADPAQLKQVLLNLVVNALHAMPDGAPTDRRGAEPRVGAHRGRDSGTGIAPEVLPQIFDPFFTTRQGGSGLGLAITAKIVREHGADNPGQNAVRRSRARNLHHAELAPELLTP
jgi:signal transduction histidine kinase